MNQNIQYYSGGLISSWNKKQSHAIKVENVCRHSTFPITLQYLESLEALTSLEFFVDVQVKNKLIKYREHAPILYIQSACDTPIKRDDYVKELMKYFKVDSYGACLNNKQMPRELMSETGTIEFYSEKLLELNSRYKFIIAIENAKCEDYITEKFWRPLIVGAIPIYLGATTIKDYLPNEKSAILMDDFHSIAALAAYITKVNNDDNLYNSYMNHKLRNQITNERLLTLFKHGGSLGQANYYYDVIPSFQCFICDAVYDKLVIDQNEKNVYDCQYPEDKTWHYSWKLGEENAERFL
ncbi:alpha-(1,3)-fucosyltransferase 10 isoform X2 [Atheta coriaria]|uniref:alpha-(1,3)-fucosyltransferase 10 isoform X2 n=1 Tax=Dalotia coriaria TaxID=877792 RepID=UPI0031F37538